MEQLYSKLTETNADIAYCDLFNPEKEEFYLKSREFDLTAFLNASFIDNCSLIRRSIIGNTRYDEKLNRKKLEDYDFLLNQALSLIIVSLKQGQFLDVTPFATIMKSILIFLRNILISFLMKFTGQFVITSWFWKRGWIACLNITMK